MINNPHNVLVIGGGAAGFFAAINLAQLRPDLKIAILERSGETLSKVKISGGGRCNVTHAQFEPKPLTTYYPRGERELLGPFHTFMTGDTIAWFSDRGVELKIEEDGRMFPISNSSQTIINCFQAEANKYNIDILLKQPVTAIQKVDTKFKITTKHQDFTCDQVIMATGSNPKAWKLLEDLGHKIIAPVPSLFTFTIDHPLINDLPGIAVQATVQVKKAKLESSGAMLITHKGLSGPAVLKLSAWGARELHALGYNFTLTVNWTEHLSLEDCMDVLENCKTAFAKAYPSKNPPFDLPKRLWRNLVTSSGIKSTANWADVSKKQLHKLAVAITASPLQVTGKNTFKDEFTTAGGVQLKEINFKTFESKVSPGIYLAGEVLNIDAITGGFNFQNAWTGAYIIAQSIATSSSN